MNNSLKTGLEILLVGTLLYGGYKGTRYVMESVGMLGTSNKIEEVSHNLQYDPDVKNPDRINEAQAANNRQVLEEMQKLMEQNKAQGIYVKPLPLAERNKRGPGYVND